MSSASVVILSIFGALIGSFINVVAYRVPLKLSVVAPPSACTQCGTRIKAYDNIPVLSWLVLRGRCRSCHTAISVRYPVIELATAVFFGLVTLWALAGDVFARWIGSSSTVGRVATCIALAAFLYLAAVSVALASIDVDTHTLPNRIVLPAYPVAAALLIVAGLLGGEPERVLTSLLGGGVMFGVYFLLALAYPGGMGFGDVKLAGLLGLYLGWLGWGSLAVGAFSAFLLGGLFSLVLILTRKANRKSGIPFGPWMLAGAWLGIFGGEAIAMGYLSLFGLT
jgi:prepilin signal peptidase PulO-like enzyme (type II secretory pathway)